MLVHMLPPRCVRLVLLGCNSAAASLVTLCNPCRNETKGDFIANANVLLFRLTQFVASRRARSATYLCKPRFELLTHTRHSIADTCIATNVPQLPTRWLVTTPCMHSVQQQPMIRKWAPTCASQVLNCSGLMLPSTHASMNLCPTVASFQPASSPCSSSFVAIL
jgi:hypothetical protein